VARTFIIGDIHGDLAALERTLTLLPPLDAADTLVFLGDYLDRGPCSAQVIERVMSLPQRTPARVVALRGNHEDAWLRVLDEGWDNFVTTAKNGTLATLRSFVGGAVPDPEETPTNDEFEAMSNASFFPRSVTAWLRSLPYWHENEHGIYVHGALPVRADGSFPHPAEVEPESTLAWCSDPSFFLGYTGKRVVVGHTSTRNLPQALSEHTPGDPSDMYRHGSVFGLDTGCGSGGFLTALELPAARVYESRRPAPKSSRSTQDVLERARGLELGAAPASSRLPLAGSELP
jgi:serine/threonine protein phosphatase 1